MWLTAAALALLGVILLYALLKPAQTAGARAQSASVGLDTYDFQLVFRPVESQLAVSMTLAFTNRTGDTLEDIMLRTWAGAYQSEEHSPAATDELFAACYPGGFSSGGIQLQGVWWNGDYAQEAAFADAAQTALRVPVGELNPGESGTLKLNCLLTIPQCAHRFGYANGVWQFGNALPILAAYDEGVWRMDAYAPVGDPFVSACANYTVSIALPKGYQCAASAACETLQTADGQKITCRALAVRDFAFALSDSWTQSVRRVNGVRVLSYAGEQKAAERAAEYALEAIKVFEALYGAYPWDTFTLCAVDFPFGGMEYPGLVLIGQTYCAPDYAATLELIVAHETAHQWFYGLVGSDQFYQPWQDEALCEYAMLRYARARYGQTAYENLLLTRVQAPMRESIPRGVTPGSPVTYFADLDGYTAVVYGRGAAFLLAAEEMTGDLTGFLRAYCDQFAFKLATREDFEALLRAWSGVDITPLMIDYLDTYM